MCQKLLKIALLFSTFPVFNLLIFKGGGLGLWGAWQPVATPLSMPLPMFQWTTCSKSHTASSMTTLLMPSLEPQRSRSTVKTPKSLRHSSWWTVQDRAFLPFDALRCTVFVIVILSVCPSVCPSVCLSHSWTVSTWLDLRSWFLHRMVAPSF